MTGFLASLEWSGPCLRLLRHVNSLDPEKPAILHIRHTERTGYSQDELVRNPGLYNPSALVSTDTGKQAAIDFGASLPMGREYVLFHTPVARTLETAESICQGIRNAGGKAVVAGKFADTPVLDLKARRELSRRRMLRYGVDAFPDDGAILWISGQNPTNIQKPSLEFAQEIARTNIDNLRNAPPKALHVCVSHAGWILVLMCHWFALLPDPDNVSFLGGFLMQLNTDGLQVWLRDKSRLYEYPYWWPTQRQ